MSAKILVSTENMPYEEWLEYRRLGIGGSDASVVCGINRYKSPVELWLDKTGQIPPQEAGEAAYWGTQLEPFVRAEFTKRTGIEVKQVKELLQSDEYPFMLANLDGICDVPDVGTCIFEAKTASAYKAGEWENTIPDEYMCQIQHYMAVTGYAGTYIAVLIGGNTFKLYEVDADEGIQQKLIALEGQFWIMVQNNIRPDIGGSDAAAEWLSKTYKGGVTEALELPQEALGFIDEYIAAAAEEDSAKARKQAAANHLKEMFGDHERGQIEGHTVGWKPVTTERLDTTALKAKEPEIVKKYTKATTSRRFTVR